MVRSQSKTVFAELAEAMHVDELLADIKPETMTCPICHREMQMREGNPDPFWRCPDNDCKYSRSIGDEPLQDGELRCRKCGGRLEFSEQGSRYVWRCQTDGRHRQSFAKSHARLPKMRSRIPKSFQRDES
jgi:ssDNA-binding Zn-finger/Zn-ribbon topoisomerase 1